MRAGPAIAAAVVATLIATGTAQATPSTDFFVDVPGDCVVGSCVATLSYDTSLLQAAVTVEIDWDTRDSAGGFSPDATLACQAPAPTDPYTAPPCTATSPVYRREGEANVAIRVTDSLDGSQATAHQLLFVYPVRSSRVPPSRQPGGKTTPDLCAPRQAGVQCGPGNGRKTSGGGDKVPHSGWPAVTGILWKVLDGGGHNKTGGPANDELLGHHGSDKLNGGDGNDILWGDWDPRNNNTRQHDVLNGGKGNDWIYPSHGSTVVRGGPGKDYVWAYYGRGSIDCGPGNDTARVKLHGPWKLHNCERVLHFCAFGSDGKGGCLKPGEKRKGRGRAAWIAARVSR
jgi:RTX calcium-binding nonapeptide repeat (4 copies)